MCVYNGRGVASGHMFKWKKYITMLSTLIPFFPIPYVFVDYCLTLTVWGEGVCLGGGGGYYEVVWMHE